MVGGKEDEGQIDGGRADLHQDGICEIADGSFSIGLARECGCELKRGRSGHAFGIGHYGTNMFSHGCRQISRILKKADCVVPEL